MSPVTKKQKQDRRSLSRGNSAFTFIDLFAGIGGFRKALESSGGKCLFTSECDPYCKETYLSNFPTHRDDENIFQDDIRDVPADKIPKHDVLAAGFPCQPFSIAGVSKKRSLGRPDGFQCSTQGTLFFEIERIIAHLKPAAFLLENVKNLASHDKQNTLRVIMETLEEKLGYEVHKRVIDASGFVPQHRERIFIVGFREPTDFSWDELQLPEKNTMSMGDILHNPGEKKEEPYTYMHGQYTRVNPKYILSEKLWEYLQAYAEKHRAKGNGFGFGLVAPKDVSRTLSARYYKDGSEILVTRPSSQKPRRLTPRECSRLMGFDDGFSENKRFTIPVSDTRAYRQFGNAVVPRVVEEIFRVMKPHVLKLKS
ncbi:DNA (cytosine-5-)-methyltransferase [Arenicellales bacterium IMCC55707]